MDDTGLLKRAAQGDDLAFELLVRRHTEPAWRLARALLGDDFAAEEAVQDTFLKAHRALDSFRGDAAVRTWLLAICRRACIDQLRLRRAEIVSLDEVRHLRASEEHVDLRIALETALAELPGIEREAFTLADVLGYSREEAAGIIGVPASTMRSRVARARSKLADALSDSDTAANGG